MRFEEISSFKNCSKIIVHNEKMKSFMHEKWKIHKDKMDILGIFDYLVENYNEELLEKRNLSRKGPVIIAGALSKHKVDIYIIYRKIVTLIYMGLILNEKKLLQIQIMLGHLIQKN